MPAWLSPFIAPFVVANVVIGLVTYVTLGGSSHADAVASDHAVSGRTGCCSRSPTP
jgi:hypothetical protein